MWTKSTVILAIAAFLQQGLAAKTGSNAFLTAQSNLARAKTELSMGLLTPSALAGIETSLISMSQQEIDANTMNFIVQIKNLIDQMKDQIRNQKAVAQSDLDGVWGDWNSCKNDAPSGTHHDITSWHNGHMQCRHEESAMYLMWRECTDEKKVLCETKNATWDGHLPSHEGWPQSCMHSEPFDDPDVTVYPYLIELRDKFQTAYNDWHTTYMTWYAAWRECADKEVECDVMWHQYLAKKKTCDEVQLKLEKFACGESNPGCDAYLECFGCNEKQFEKTTASIRQSEAIWVEEYNATLRIGAIICAFENCKDKSQAANLCIPEQVQNCGCFTEAECAPLLQVVKIAYHPAADEKLPVEEECKHLYYGEQPGTLVFTKNHFGELPEFTTFNTCNANCCVRQAGCCYSFREVEDGPCCLTRKIALQSNCIRQEFQDWSLKCPITSDMAKTMISR